ncbi:MAG TPA: hypothetical protein VK211_14605, partial [Kamptonema sp.]|nr:hypothetical protein [Kamptonema sp.]
MATWTTEVGSHGFTLSWEDGSDVLKISHPLLPTQTITVPGFSQLGMSGLVESGFHDYGPLHKLGPSSSFCSLDSIW